MTPAARPARSAAIRGGERDLEPDQQHVAVGEHRGKSVEVLRPELRQHAGRDGDAVLAARVDEDDADHRRPGPGDDPVVLDALVVPECSAPSPKASAPTAVNSVTRAPRRRAATAWFDPLPPWPVLKERPMTVSPASGTRSVTNVSPTP